MGGRSKRGPFQTSQRNLFLLLSLTAYSREWLFTAGRQKSLFCPARLPTRKPAQAIAHPEFLFDPIRLSSSTACSFLSVLRSRDGARVALAGLINMVLLFRTSSGAEKEGSEALGEVSVD